MNAETLIRKLQSMLPGRRRAVTAPEPPATRLRWPNEVQLKALLRPGADPTRQWDGSPAITGPPRVDVRSRPGNRYVQPSSRRPRD